MPGSHRDSPDEKKSKSFDRTKWEKGHRVLVYYPKKKGWCNGKILKIYHNREESPLNDMMKVCYCIRTKDERGELINEETKTIHVRRDSRCIC